MEVGKIELPSAAKWVIDNSHSIGEALITEIRLLRNDLNRRDAELLDSYSRWLEKHSYMDSDWYTEGNTVQEFLGELKEKK